MNIFYDSNVIAIVSTVLAIVIYVLLLVIIKGKRYLRSGTSREKELILNNFVTIDELQNNNWASNFSLSISFATFSLATAIITITLLFQTDLNNEQKTLVNIASLFLLSSIISYFISIQFWMVALDRGRSIDMLLKFRRIATTYQNLGMIFIALGLVSAVYLLDYQMGRIKIGHIYSLITIVGIIIIIQGKAITMRNSEHKNAGLNDFQKKIAINKIYKKIHLTDETKEPYRNIKLLSWNIERGYEPKSIIDYIKNENPSIICLQEVDWNNKRTDEKDVLGFIAEELKMNGYFLTEFIEIESPKRSKVLQGGGVHGNAILSKIQPKKVFGVNLPVEYDWGNSVQKRIGSRNAICAEFNIANRRVVICSTHLEDKVSNPIRRIVQFDKLYKKLENDGYEHMIIAGDMNTIYNRISGLFNFSDPIIKDGKKIKQSEKVYWSNNFLKSLGLSDPFKKSDWTLKKHFIYKEKLDWIILKNIAVNDKGVGGFNTSDHKPLWITIDI